MQTSVIASAGRDRKSDWAGFACFSVWTLINAVLAVGVFRRSPAVACLLVPTFAHEALIAVAFLLRRPLIRQAEGWVPRVVAYAATFMIPAFCFVSSLLRPQWMKPSAPPVFVAGVVLWLIGAYLGLWSLLRLRRAFSIVPQARTLVTDGPYCIARHPVYASYLLQYGGVVLSHVSPALAVLFVVWLATVMLRVAYEERVLAVTFPEYESYRQQVGRFAPRFSRRPATPDTVLDPRLSSPATSSRAEAGARL